MLTPRFFAAIAVLLSAAPLLAESFRAPLAEQRPFVHEKFGDRREDPYAWLNQRKDQKVLAYLQAENLYTDQVMADSKDLQRNLVDEFTKRLEPIAESVPYKEKGYAYFTSTKADENYASYYRYPIGQPEKRELLLDGNSLAKGQSFFSLAHLSVSPDDKLLAYAVDSTGRRFYTIHVLDRVTRKPVLTIPDVTGEFEWTADSMAIVYTRQDRVTLRSFEAWRRPIKAPKPTLLYREADTTFTLGLEKSRSGHFFFLNSNSTLSSEVRYLDARNPKAKALLFQKRQRDLEYSIEDGGDRFYILSNFKAPNFRLLETRLDQTSLEHWKELVPADAETHRTGFEVFANFLVLHERKGGADLLRVYDRKEQSWRSLTFPDPVYSVSSYINAEYESSDYLYHYESLATPPSVYRLDFSTGAQALVKEEPVLGGFDKGKYTSERVFVKARDGASIPLSLVYRKDLKRDGTAPALIYGYGSYGVTIDPHFSLTRLSLLDRGFVYAIAHVRGGAMLGRSWYEAGKLLNKKNTFQDFIDCSQFLIDQRYTQSQKLFAMGGSAGGLLMGAVTNMRPDLYRGIIAQVPFVDVVTTMLDESIPLTTGEYDEWGDPRKKEYYEYMKSYSPYDNVEAKAYPNILVTTGLHDSQVQYWEPAKWVARLRTKAQGNPLILLKTDMNAGHGGASGRISKFEEQAFVYGFILKVLQSTPSQS